MFQEKDSVRLHIKDLAVREEIEKAIASLEGFELQRSSTWEPCSLLILEIGEDLQKEFELIRQILASGEVETIFVTSPRYEADILVQALRAGVKEFLSQPIMREDLVSALLKFRDRPSSGTRTEGKISEFLPKYPFSSNRGPHATGKRFRKTAHQRPRGPGRN